MGQLAFVTESTDTSCLHGSKSLVATWTSPIHRRRKEDKKTMVRFCSRSTISNLLTSADYFNWVNIIHLLRCTICLFFIGETHVAKASTVASVSICHDHLKQSVLWEQDGNNFAHSFLYDPKLFKFGLQFLSICLPVEAISRTITHVRDERNVALTQRKVLLLSSWLHLMQRSDGSWLW